MSRRGRPRGRTVAIRNMSRTDLEIGRWTYPAIDGVEKPRTRGECVEGVRPCPWVSCRHHLYLEVNSESGSIKFNFPALEVDELAESCSLDVADRGEHTLEQVGRLTNLTRERARQIETRALVRNFAPFRKANAA
jgi:hypothetical protein